MQVIYSLHDMFRLFLRYLLERVTVPHWVHEESVYM
jgi:hypothetical protein